MSKTTREAISIKLSTPGKVILHGEHSVVYGKAAIAASLGLRTRLLLSEEQTDSDRNLTVNLESLNYTNTFSVEKLVDADVAYATTPSDFNVRTPLSFNHEVVLAHVESFVKTLAPPEHHQSVSLTALLYLYCGIFSSVNVDVRSLSLTVETELSVSAGTGSSASFLVSVAAAFVQYVRVKAAQAADVSKPSYKPVRLTTAELTSFPDDVLETISGWAYNAERIIHGKPSGIDNAVCAYGAMVQFRRGHPPKVLKVTDDFRMLLINTRVSRNTKTLVAKVAQLKTKYPDVVDALMDALDAVAQRAVVMFGSAWPQDVEERRVLYDDVQELVDVNQGILRALGVSHPALETICDTVRRFGLRAKLTGAGGGGYALCIVPSHFENAAIDELCRCLDGLGFEAVLTELGGPGVRLE